MGKVWNQIKSGASKAWSAVKSSPKGVWNQVKGAVNWAEKNIPGVKDAIDYAREKVPGAALIEKGLAGVDRFINDSNVGQAASAIGKQLLMRNGSPLDGTIPMNARITNPARTAISELNNSNRFL